MRSVRRYRSASSSLRLSPPSIVDAASLPFSPVLLLPYDDVPCRRCRPSSPKKGEHQAMHRIIIVIVSPARREDAEAAAREHERALAEAKARSKRLQTRLGETERALQEVRGVLKNQREVDLPGLKEEMERMSREVEVSGGVGRRWRGRGERQSGMKASESQRRVLVSNSRTVLREQSLLTTTSTPSALRRPGCRRPRRRRGQRPWPRGPSRRPGKRSAC